MQQDRSLSLATMCRTTQGRIALTMTNLSTTSCTVQSHRYPLIEGDRVSLSFAGYEFFPGWVTQSEGLTAEIQFDEALYPAVVDHLNRTYPS